MVEALSLLRKLRNEKMKLEGEFTEEEIEIIRYYCGNEASFLNEMDNSCYVFDLDGQYLYDQCFEKAKNDYFARKKYNRVKPIKAFEFAKYYIMKCYEYEGLWFKGRLDANGNYEFTTNSEELSIILESL